MQTSVTNVTPTMARNWIDASSNRNRALNARRVRQYADLMLAGKWVLNGESVIFDDNGNLIDGQHRLEAVVLSKTTVQMVIVRGVSPSAFKTIDVGRKRTPGDTLHVAGFANSNRAASVTTGILTFRSDGCFAKSANPGRYEAMRLDPDFDIVSAANSLMPALEESVKLTYRWSSSGQFSISPSLAGATHFLFAENDQELADEFFARMTEIRFEGANDPTKRLYELCTRKGKREAMQVSCYYAGAMFIKAWNHFVKGSPCAFLRFNDDEQYPTILNPKKILTGKAS